MEVWDNTHTDTGTNGTHTYAHTRLHELDTVELAAHTNTQHTVLLQEVDTVETALMGGAWRVWGLLSGKRWPLLIP